VSLGFSKPLVGPGAFPGPDSAIIGIGATNTRFALGQAATSRAPSPPSFINEIDAGLLELALNCLDGAAPPRNPLHLLSRRDFKLVLDLLRLNWRPVKGRRGDLNNDVAAAGGNGHQEGHRRFRDRARVPEAAAARAARLQNTDEHVIGEKRYIKGVVVS
jgi:hypothetical protein